MIMRYFSLLSCIIIPRNIKTIVTIYLIDSEICTTKIALAPESMKSDYLFSVKGIGDGQDIGNNCDSIAGGWGERETRCR